MAKNLPAIRETQVLFLGGYGPPGEGNGLTTPVFLPGESHGQSLQSMGLQRIR